MSEEEIIKNIEDMLLHAETNLLDYEALAIQGLLDLYKAKKEKNKKIEDKIKRKIEWYQQYCDLDDQTIRALEDILE